MTAFTEQQVAALSAPLSRAHVKGRKQGGRQVSYLEGWHIIAEANRIFGFAEWDRETVECRCVSEKQCVIGAGGQYEKPGFRVAYVGKVRVTVRAGDQVVVREGTGYGSGIDVDVGEAHESAAKECETDAMKRCLMTFGNPFGLALYDKDQAEVAPAPAAGARNAAPPSPANGHAPPAARPGDRERELAEASAIKDRIKAAIENATTPKLIDEIVEINKVDLALVKKIHAPTYEKLMVLANGRKSELYAEVG